MTTPSTLSSVEDALRAAHPEFFRPQKPVGPSSDGDGIAILTQTALRWAQPSQAIPPAKGDRRPLQERLEAQERASVMATAYSAPHRRGFPPPPEKRDRNDETIYADDSRLDEPLFWYCQIKHLREECYRAGQEYNWTLRRFKVAKGFLHVDLRINDEERSVFLRPEEIEAMRSAAIEKKDRITNLLKTIHHRAPAVMENLCFAGLWPDENDAALITACLLRLADDAGMLDRGINREKPI